VWAGNPARCIGAAPVLSLADPGVGAREVRVP